jgi:inosine/xanthosine triphosphatase
MEWKKSGNVVIAIGSKNPVKVNSSISGVQKALQPLCDADIQVSVSGTGFNVSSDVSDQPIGEMETKTGACNRARKAWDAFIAEVGKTPDYSVGLEGGIINNEDEAQMICSAWMAVYNGSSMGTARTCSFPLPEAIRQLVQGGMELGDADDKVFGGVNSKQQGGTVGHLSRGVIDRTAYYEPAVVLAMVPLLWPDLYN